MGTLRAFEALRYPFLAALAAFACASPPPAETPPTPEATAEPASTPPAAASASAPNPEAAAPASPEAPSAAPPTPAPTPPPTPPSFVELCNKMCDRVAQRCSESAAEGCRMNCTQYEHPPAGCDGQVRRALECSAKAEDLTCVNIAPESCAADFRRVVACASGKPEGAMPEDPTKVPEDWKVFQSANHGFSAPMPAGVTEQAGAPEPTYSVTAGDATYSVRILPAPAEKPTQKSLVKVGMGLVGKCTKGLKLFSLVDRPERVTINFKSGCPGDIELNGFIVIAAGKMYVLEVRAPRAAKVPKDPFFYNFELRSPA